MFVELTCSPPLMMHDWPKRVHLSSAWAVEWNRRSSVVIQEGSVAVVHSREALNSLVFIRNGHIYRILEKSLFFSSKSSSISTIVLKHAERSETVNYEHPEVTMAASIDSLWWRRFDIVCCERWLSQRRSGRLPTQRVGAWCSHTWNTGFTEWFVLRNGCLCICSAADVQNRSGIEQRCGRNFSVVMAAGSRHQSAASSSSSIADALFNFSTWLFLPFSPSIVLFIISRTSAGWLSLSLCHCLSVSCTQLFTGGHPTPRLTP